DDDLDGQRGPRRRAAEAADLHGDLLDIRTSARGSEITVAVDLSPADVDLDGAAETAAAEILAEDGEIRAFVVLTAGVRPRGHIRVKHMRCPGRGRRGSGGNVDRERRQRGRLSAIADGDADIRIGPDVRGARGATQLSGRGVEA